MADIAREHRLVDARLIRLRHEAADGGIALGRRRLIIEDEIPARDLSAREVIVEHTILIRIRTALNRISKGCAQESNFLERTLALYCNHVDFLAAKGYPIPPYILYASLLEFCLMWLRISVA